MLAFAYCVLGGVLFPDLQLSQQAMANANNFVRVFCFSGCHKRVYAGTPAVGKPMRVCLLALIGHPQTFIVQRAARLPPGVISWIGALGLRLSAVSWHRYSRKQ